MKKQNVNHHGESDRKNSWYWNVLLKNMGTWKKAEKAVKKSRELADPSYNSMRVF